MSGLGPEALFAALRSASPATPAEFLYDEAGNALYSRLCESQEYDLARRETALLLEYLSTHRGNSETIIDLGCGAGRKIARVLSQAKCDVEKYVGVDSSAEALEQLRQVFAGTDIPNPITRCSGLSEYLCDSGRHSGDWEDATLVLFLGTTMGNLSHVERVDLLGAVRRHLRPDTRLLVGCDMRKSTEAMIGAYSDSAGFAALAGLNAICQVNMVLGSSVQPSSFRHEVRFNESTGDIETFLVTREPVTFDGAHMSAPLVLHTGARIRTNRSHKFTVKELHDEATAAALNLTLRWSDQSYVLAEYATAISKSDARN